MNVIFIYSLNLLYYNDMIMCVVKRRRSNVDMYLFEINNNIVYHSIS